MSFALTCSQFTDASLGLDMGIKKRNLIAHDLLTSRRFSQKTIRNKKKDWKPDADGAIGDERKSTDLREEP